MRSENIFSLRRICYSMNEFFQCIFFFVFPITNKSVWINKIRLINNLSKGKSAHKAIIKTYHRLKSCPNFRATPHRKLCAENVTAW